MAAFAIDAARSTPYSARLQLATAGVPGPANLLASDIIAACVPGALKTYLSRLPTNTWSGWINNVALAAKIEIIPTPFLGICNPDGMVITGSAADGVAVLQGISTNMGADCIFTMRFIHSLYR